MGIRDRFSKLAIGSGVMFEMGVRMTTVWSVSLVRSIGLGMSKFRNGTLGYRNRIVADACTIVWQRGLGELRLTTRNLLVVMFFSVYYSDDCLLWIDRSRFHW